MIKTSKVHGGVFNWETCARACRSPETRSRLRSKYETLENLVDACTAVEDELEFVKGKLARTEKERLRDVRRIGEGMN